MYERVRFAEGDIFVEQKVLYYNNDGNIYKSVSHDGHDTSYTKNKYDGVVLLL